MPERTWTPYDNPMWVTSPEVCLISDDDEFLLAQPDADDERWVVLRRDHDWDGDPLGDEEYEYFGEAATREQAIALLPPPA
jgi:hypothetical protein